MRYRGRRLPFSAPAQVQAEERVRSADGNLLSSLEQRLPRSVAGPALLLCKVAPPHICPQRLRCPSIVHTFMVAAILLWWVR